MFRDINPSELSTLASQMEELPIKKGMNLLTQNQLADGVYYIEEGRVEILVNGEIVGHGSKNESFGEMSCLSGELNASATVKTATDSKVLRISREQFLRSVNSNPKLSQHIFRVLTGRIQLTNQRLSEVLHHTPQGLVKIDRYSKITSEYSIRCTQYFGTHHLIGQYFHEFMFARNEEARISWLQIYALIFDETFMNFAQITDLMPKQTSLLGPDGAIKYYELSYYPCLDQEKNIIAVDIGIEDITKKIELEKATAILETERLILQQMYDNPEAFFSVLNLSDETLKELSGFIEYCLNKQSYSDDQMLELLRSLHSLKGSSGMFSLTRIQDTAHQIEGCLKEQQEKSPEEFINQLKQLVTELSLHTKMAHELVNQMSEELRRRIMGVVISSEVLHELKIAAEKKDHAKIYQLLLRLEKISLKNLIITWPEEIKRLSNKLGKNIQFRAKGEALVISKVIFECLSNNLIHLLRNSVDHGIETPLVRLNAKKNEVGTIQFTAFEQDCELIIEISDDGNGLNFTKIISIAKSKTHLDQVQIELYIKNQEVWKILFLPGFSTAEQVSEISGRGVGMDAILTAVQSLNGKIEVESTEGQGTKFRLRLPH